MCTPYLETSLLCVGVPNMIVWAENPLKYSYLRRLERMQVPARSNPLRSMISYFRGIGKVIGVEVTKKAPKTDPPGSGMESAPFIISNLWTGTYALMVSIPVRSVCIACLSLPRVWTLSFCFISRTHVFWWTRCLERTRLILEYKWRPYHDTPSPA